MALLDHQHLADYPPFQARVKVATATLSEALGLGTVTIPAGVTVTLTQCGKLTQAMMTGEGTYLPAMCLAVTDYPAVASVIDALQTGLAPQQYDAAVSDALITEAVEPNFFELAANF